MTSDACHIDVRPAGMDDAGVLLDLTKGLAEYEHLSHLVTATEELLAKWLFGPRPAAEAVIARLDGRPAGFAVFFPNFSTFLGKPGMYLEDLYVRPELRGRGIGKALLFHVARLALERGCGRMEWSVLDWNAPAIDFYQSLGAKPLDDWTIFRLLPEDMTKLL
jgi:GNAT superfamily N-acetyltransferase